MPQSVCFGDSSGVGFLCFRFSVLFIYLSFLFYLFLFLAALQFVSHCETFFLRNIYEEIQAARKEMVEKIKGRSGVWCVVVVGVLTIFRALSQLIATGQRDFGLSPNEFISCFFFPFFFLLFFNTQHCEQFHLGTFFPSISQQLKTKNRNKILELSGGHIICLSICLACLGCLLLYICSRSSCRALFSIIITLLFLYRFSRLWHARDFCLKNLG